MLVKKKQQLSIDQVSVAKVVATRLGLDLPTVMSVIEMEQKTTMSYIKRGYRVVKKNYMTLIPKVREEYSFTSGINGKKYDIGKSTKVNVRIGEGFKAYVSEANNMSNKLCRFVVKEKNPL